MCVLQHRREFLKRLAWVSLGGVLAQSSSAETAREEQSDATWSGIVFGIEMSAEWFGVSEGQTQRLAESVEKIARALESAVSLYSEDSDLSRLNRDRVLEHPSDVFRDLLGKARELSARTHGLFQPAIHAAWEQIDAANFSELLAAATLENVSEREQGIELTHALTQLSFNACVQGYFADKVAEVARACGVRSALLNLGESYAIGQHPEGRSWNLAVMDTAGEGEILGTLALSDSGMAVSSHSASRQLLHPVKGKLEGVSRVAAVVSAEGACVADAFATAFAVADTTEREALYKALHTGGNCSVKVWDAGALSFSK